MLLISASPDTGVLAGQGQEGSPSRTGSHSDPNDRRTRSAPSSNPKPGTAPVVMPHRPGKGSFSGCPGVVALRHQAGFLRRHEVSLSQCPKVRVPVVQAKAMANDPVFRYALETGVEKVVIPARSFARYGMGAFRRILRMTSGARRRRKAMVPGLLSLWRAASSRRVRSGCHCRPVSMARCARMVASRTIFRVRAPSPASQAPRSLPADGDQISVLNGSRDIGRDVPEGRVERLRTDPPARGASPTSKADGNRSRTAMGTGRVRPPAHSIPVSSAGHAVQHVTAIGVSA